MKGAAFVEGRLLNSSNAASSKALAVATEEGTTISLSTCTTFISARWSSTAATVRRRRTKRAGPNIALGMSASCDDDVVKGDDDDDEVDEDEMVEDETEEVAGLEVIDR